jgi:hypothetical protein
MRIICAVASIIFLIVGVLGAALASTFFVSVWAAPIQPPASHNEWPGLARFIGWLLLFPSLAAVVVGAAMVVGIRRSRSPDDIARARRHKRLC